MKAFCFNVRDFEAVGSGQTLDTEAIQSAIDACHRSGGGTVYFPAGDYLSGSLRLKNNVSLYLDAGATLWGSTNVDDYPTDSLIYAEEARHISIVGSGTINGNGESFWIDRNSPEYPGQAHLKRPHNLILLVECQDIKIHDITILSTPCWNIHLLACDRVMVRGITVTSPFHGPNTDGIDLNACRDVMISDCRITTGDDAIVLKNQHHHPWQKGPIKKRVRPSRNITVQNCILTTTSNAFKIGTETMGDLENITFSNSVIYAEPGDSEMQVRSGIAIESVDGAHLRNITISNISMVNVNTPIFIRLGHRGIKKWQMDPAAGSIDGVMISNVIAAGALYPSIIAGIPDHPIHNVRLSNLHIKTAGGGTPDQAEIDVPELPDHYPEATMFGVLPAYGFYCRHVAGLHMMHLELIPDQEDARPMIVADDVLGFVVDGLIASKVSPGSTTLRLVDVQDAWLRNCRARADVFVDVRGEGSRGILVTYNDLRSTREVVRRSDEVSVESVTT